MVRRAAGPSRARGAMMIRMEDVIATHLDELQALCRRFQVKRLELFGSAAS